MDMFKKTPGSLYIIKTSQNGPGVFLLFLTVSVLILSACASMQTPTGGPKDAEAPKVVKESPKNMSTKFNAKQVEIEFDEFIKLNNAFSEISISPALENPLDIQAKKERLEIKLTDSLAPQTTYTINFGKAIGDVNENNLLKNYSYVFSTGDVLDSLSVSGKVIDALSKEPLKEATVFILPVNQDSLLGKKKPSIYTSTDSSGGFTLKNLRAQDYKIYALKESAVDRIYNEAIDEIGFLDSTLVLKKNISGLKFSVFKEEPSKIKVLEKKIENDGTILLSLNKGVRALTIKEENTNFLSNMKSEVNPRGDSIKVWLPALEFDSLRLSVYDQERELDKVTIYRNKRETLNRTPVIRDNAANGKLRPGRSMEIQVSMPVNSVDMSKISLLSDSVKIQGWNLLKKGGSVKNYQLIYPLRTSKKYSLSIQEGAFTGISGIKNKAYKKDFTLEDSENYGNLNLKISAPDTSGQYLIQLLSEGKTVIHEEVVFKEKTINYTSYPVGKYNIRIVKDDNKNGKWDTGNVSKNRQPEQTWTYDKVITLRANWDLEEKITIPKDL
ncbi:MAG: hypothetical protein RI924_1400 [Bacteroidota bacterium]|jgi:hypothetical protein